MDYREARTYLDGITKYGSVFGLESMRSLLELLGNPQKKLSFIHIAGTNGKGSVLAFVSSVLTRGGYRVGRYCSPSVFSYREKIQVNEVPIDRESLAKLTGRVRIACEELVAKGRPQPTVFEVETALAFLYFLQENCELAVVEAGLGGLLDATNVIDTTKAAVLTSISMDHMGVLGDSLEEIAQQKAGIFKEGCQAVCLKQTPEVMEVISRAAKEKHCELTLADRTRAFDISYGLEKQSFTYISERGTVYKNCVIHQAGTYQIDNAVLALEVLEAICRAGYPVSTEAVREGLSTACWPGRFSVISKKPLIILDGAHNEDGARRLAQSIRICLDGKKKIFIMGVFSDKEYKKIAELTAPLADRIFTIQTPDNPRALDAGKLKEAVLVFQPNTRRMDSIREAVRAALEAADEDSVIIGFGSLSHLKELYREFQDACMSGE